MSGLGAEMARKGFIPLRDDGLGAIGFKPKMNNNKAIMPFREVWFDTGLRMPAGTIRSVAARNQAEYDEYLKKGWKPIIAEAKKNDEQREGSGATVGKQDIQSATEVGQGGAVVPGGGTEGKTGRGKGRPKKEK